MVARVVTFDFGKTLAHWRADPRRYFGVMCRLAGIQVSEAAALAGAQATARLWQTNPPPPSGTASAAWWRMHNLEGLRAAGMQGDLAALSDAMERADHAFPAGWVLDPDVPDVLDSLREKQMRLAVVSNSDGTLNHRLESLGIAARFEYVADSAIVGVRKPHPEIYLATCRALGVAPEECVHVGDRPDADGVVALAVGATPVIYDPLECLNGEWLRVSRLRDLPSLIQSLHGRTTAF